MTTSTSLLEGSPTLNRSSRRTFSRTAFATPPTTANYAASITTPTLPHMARFPTNTMPAHTEASSANTELQAGSTTRYHVLSPYTSSPGSPDETSTRPSLATMDVEPTQPTSFSISFVPSFTMNNPYVRPYVETLVYPIELLGQLRARRWRSPESISRSHWEQGESGTDGDIMAAMDGAARFYANETEELYMSRLLSPTPEMYEDHSRLMSRSHSFHPPASLL